MPVDKLEEDLKPALDQLVTVDVKVLKTIQKLLQVPPRTREDEYYEDIQMQDIAEMHARSFSSFSIRSFPISWTSFISSVCSRQRTLI
jgi:hypothetical protein